MPVLPRRLRTPALLALVTSLALPAWPCSRVFAPANPNQRVVGRTMDLFINDGAALALRPRGLEAGGMLGMPDPQALRWRARYGSAGVLSLNRVISDGLNERGLSANLLYLGNSVYPTRNRALPGLSNARLAEYVLDNFASVKEAIAGLRRVQVVSDQVLKRHWGLHLSLADRNGDSAVVEFLNGAMVVREGRDTWVMTNEPELSWQLRNLRRYKPFGGSLPLPGDIDPPSRFVRASAYLRTLPQAKGAIQAEADLAGLMKTVSVPAGAQDYSSGDSEDTWVTLWTSVANLSAGTYTLQLSNSPAAVWVELARLNWSGTAMGVLTLQGKEHSGDVSALLNSAPRHQPDQP